jgi:very-short-patch-repair endonuclease
MGVTAMNRIDSQVVMHSRRLRGGMTDAEKKLWRHLRMRQIGRHKFRRQFPLEGYIADFACVEKKLVVEVDGGQHAEDAEYDAQRSLAFEKLGYRTLRFWNNEVLGEIEAVKAVIARALGLPPS